MTLPVSVPGKPTSDARLEQMGVNRAQVGCVVYSTGAKLAG